MFKVTIKSDIIGYRHEYTFNTWNEVLICLLEKDYMIDSGTVITIIVL